MTHKVLLADDSQTIQKVIKITLANEPYTLIDCKTEQDLLTNTQVEQPSLVLLDFSLSETQSGYELCKAIIKLSPKTSVLMMYGTFDTVDENALRNCGAKSKIIKPFDSTKFINLCRSLIEEVQTSSVEFKKEEAIEEVSLPKNEEDLSWVLNAPKVEDKKPELKAEKPSDVLTEKINEWGLRLPGVIGEASQASAGILKFPPVINESAKVEISPSIGAEVGAKEKIEEEVTSLPKADDLEYPDMTSPSSTGAISKLVPLSQMKSTSTNEILLDESLDSFDLSIENGTTSEEDIRKLEEQIQDELEHVTPRKKPDPKFEKDLADLWTADEFETSNPTMQEITEITKETLKNSDVELKFEYKTEPKIETKPVTGPTLPSIDNEIEDKLRVAMKPVLEELVREYCQKTLEKVAWEVIPDLAENLIKKELKRISDSIIEE